MENFKRNRHSVYNLQYHLVVMTKNRNKLINKNILSELKNISERLISDRNGSLIEFNGAEDHIHVIFEFPPQVELAKWINTFKTVSSRLIRKNHAEHLNGIYQNNVFWARNYLIATTGVLTSDIIKKYLENKEQEKD